MTSNARAAETKSLAIAFWVFPLLTCLLLLLYDEVAHWFVLPVTLCGIIIGTDGIRWFRRKVDIFDPAGIVGVYGVFFFYVAPLLHPITGYWLGSVSPPQDWRTWLGYMALINAVGLFAYKLGLEYFSRKTIVEKTVALFNRRKLVSIAILLLPLLALLQIYIYQSLGGIEAYISTAISPDAESNMQGLGVVFAISESFPVVALIFYLGLRKQRSMSWLKIGLILLVYLVLALMFGGLRGSRSNTVWGLFFAVSAIHFWVRPINKKVVLIGIVFLTAFMYAYGFFKAGGIETLSRALESGDERAAIEQTHSRSSTMLLLGDLGRSDVQSFLLYRKYGTQGNQDVAYGRTYLGAAALLIPSFIWNDRPVTKVQEGTNTLHGQGSYSPGVLSASNVYGLAGETILNFGIFAIPLLFFMWGCLVGKIKSFINSLADDDARRLLVPILINFCVVVLVSDSDNIVFFIFKNFAVPATLIWFCSKRSSYQKI